MNDECVLSLKTQFLSPETVRQTPEAGTRPDSPKQRSPSLANHRLFMMRKHNTNREVDYTNTPLMDINENESYFNEAKNESLSEPEPHLNLSTCDSNNNIEQNLPNNNNMDNNINIDGGEDNDRSHFQGDSGILSDPNSSAFERVQRIGLPTLPIQLDTDVGETTLTTNDGENHRRYGTIFGPLPRAYPVPFDHRYNSFNRNNRRRGRNRGRDGIVIASTENNNNTQGNNDNDNEGEEEESKSMKSFKISFGIIFFLFVLLSVLLAVLLLFPNDSNVKDDNIYSDAGITNETKSEEDFEIKNSNDTATATTSNTSSSDIEKPQPQFTCFTDPIIVQTLEFEAQLRGEDPSIVRTYVFCPNSTMNVFDFDPYIYKFDFTKGEVFPLIIWRPNVRILCGFDGAYSNNCTFQGGFFHVDLCSHSLFDDPISYSNLVSYGVSDNNTAVNITIQGFRFTNAKSGFNVMGRSARISLTLKDCVFDNNFGMMGSVLMTPFYGGRSTTPSSLYIQDTIFQDNSYAYNPNVINTDNPNIDGVQRDIPNIGIITSYPTESHDAVVNIHVNHVGFYNNTFSLREKEESGKVQESTKVTTAVFNLLLPTLILDIQNSCFVRNQGYSNSLFLLLNPRGEAGEEVRYYFDTNVDKYLTNNHFSDNSSDDIIQHSNESIDLPSSSLNSSCVVNYQTIYFIDGLPMNVTLEYTDKKCDENSYIFTPENEIIVDENDEESCIRMI